MGKVSKGIIWNFVNKFSNQIIGFVVGILLARMVSPSSYGLIAMISAFVSITGIIIDAGFSNALIQKKDRTDRDYSTVFVFNIVISFFFYAIIFLCSPFIAKFYNEPRLTLLTRVVTLPMIIGCFNACQGTRLTINLDFKTLGKIGIISNIISGIVGVACAYCGLDVWALVIQTIVGSVVNVVLTISITRWMPKFCFYKDSFKQLFSFGSKLMFVNILTSIYLNIYNLFIGKKYNAEQLAYYNKGFSLSQLPSTNIEGIMQSVFYPVMCNLQNDKEQLIKTYFHYLHFSNFIIIPLLTIMLTLARPLVYVVLTPKWLPAVPYIQIFCINFMMFSWINQSNNLIKAVGKSDIMLKLEIINRIISFLILIVSLNFGVLAICIGIVISTFIELMIGIYFDRRLFHITYAEQLKSQYDVFLLCAIQGFALILLDKLIPNPYVLLFLGAFCGILIYILEIFVFKLNERYYIKSIFYKIISR